MGNDSGRFERGLQPFDEMRRFVRLIAQEDQRMRPPVGRFGRMTMKRGDRHGQFVINVFQVRLRGRIVRHPHQVDLQGYALPSLTRIPDVPEPRRTRLAVESH